MKRLIMFIVLCSFVLLFTTKQYCRDFSEFKKKSVVANIVQAINSDNTGLRIDAAFSIFEFVKKQYFTEVDFSPAVAPLRKMLLEGKTEMERIVAALSLCEIEDGAGFYPLRDTTKPDKSEKDTNVNKDIYFHYQMPDSSYYLIDY